jgi:salicylate hydroxylase/6-hydroxynicotinate 3-monooxygenase
VRVYEQARRFARLGAGIQMSPNAMHKWAILVRDPLARWRGSRTVLLGDACHPMTPYMAQGAAMAMEDGVVLARCLEACPGDPGAALARYEATRAERTARVQAASLAKRWMSEATDPGWVYGYDAWRVPLA